MDLSRRALLRASGVGAAAVTAGCLDFASGDGPQGPEGTPGSLECSEEGFRRIDPPFDDEDVTFTSAETRDGVRFELAAQGDVETYGNELRLTLRNLEGTETEIGNDEQIAVQRQVAGGWEDVRGTTDGSDVTFPDGTTTVGSGGGHSWSLRLREDAIAETLSTAELEVCPPLGPGTHRFVYWGLPGDVAIAREFELIG